MLRPVNPSIYGPEEIAEKLSSGHLFLSRVMSRERLVVLAKRITWRQLLDASRVRRSATRKQKLDDLRTGIKRDLHEAGVSRHSADSSFATAYNAVLQPANVAIARAGHRIAGMGHQHRFP